MNIKSYCKINLSLAIKGKREDGYHDLEMINLPIDLHDVILINAVKGLPDTYVTCDDIRLMGIHSNMCTRAVEAMRARYHFPQNFLIHIHKEIPFAAGLGGGSSNAASVLLAINKMLKLGASREELAEIALSLGADVPYFLDPHPMLVEGIGEKLTPIEIGPKYCALIVKPKEGLSTKEVYALCDLYPHEEIHTDNVIEGLQEGDLHEIAVNRGNDLFPSALSMLPKLQDILLMFQDDGLEVRGMTGSGSSCFALLQDEKLAKRLYKKYKDQGLDVYLAHVTK